MPIVELRGGEVDGLSVHYVVEGHGGPPIILVHGLGGFAEYWQRTIPSLAGRATVYALDLPGFGQSAKPRATYGPAYFAGALRGFMDALGISRASFVGHSLGGTLAVAFALTHPARIERLALLGAVVPGFPYRLSWPARLAALPWLGEALSLGGCAALYKTCIARCFYASARREVDFLVESFYDARTSPEARAAFLATVRRFRSECLDRATDYRRALGTLDVPMLLIHGRQDPVVPAAHCAEAATALPRATVRWIDCCGHFPHLEHAPLVNGWLGQFLIGRTAPR